MTGFAKNALLGLLLCTVMVACKHKHADMVLINGIVHTMNTQGDVVQAVAISDGKILQTGRTEDLLFEYATDTVIDLKGATVLPGLIDAHCHFFGYAENLSRANLVGTLSWEGALVVLDSFAVAKPDGWILGRGWDQNDWPHKEWPTNEELNRRFPDRPVFLKRIDGHAAIVNQAALDIAGITERTSIEGGSFIRDRRGRLTGLLIDNAVDEVEKFIPPVSSKEMIGLLKQTQNLLHQNGITTVSDAGLNLNQIMIIDSLHKAGVLDIRVYAMANPTEENLEKWLPMGPYRSDFLSVSSFKVYADGALGSRGACLLKPYKDAPGEYGFLLHPEEYYFDLAQKLYDGGFQMNTHCIGDSANRFILHVYGSVLKGQNNRRWRIEHAQVIHPDDFALFDEYDVLPSVQPTHATSDMYWAEDRIGKERMQGAYAYKQLLAQNKSIAFGTDFPVEHINPMRTLYAATQRVDTAGFPYGGFQIQDAVGLDTALRAMTIWAAYANMEESSKGSIEAGKFADFAVLDRNPYGIEPKDLYKLKVVKTILHGKVVWAAEE